MDGNISRSDGGNISPFLEMMNNNLEKKSLFVEITSLALKI